MTKHDSGVCHVVGAGDFDPALLRLRENDLLIAADGGLKALTAAGLTPHRILGDMDSLGFVPHGDNVTLLPKEKDVTDLLAAAEEGKKRGYRRFLFYGALGGRRFSHSLANLSLLLGLCKEGLEGSLMDPLCTVTCLGKGCYRPVKSGGYFSLFAAIEGTVLSVEGAKYELREHTLSPTFALGVSNEGNEATRITVHRGFAFLVLDA
ncbi:MAG: thiamine diphosphokinase [Clostridia bacterium]|nr:thiamine diphosphokinase [Clostridia bacterium]